MHEKQPILVSCASGSLIRGNNPLDIFAGARPDRPRQSVATMSLSVEQAGPKTRAVVHLPPKSYANEVEEALNQDDPPVDESLIKESPPRPKHARQDSEPRPLGEVFEEASRPSSPSSPRLRHPRGRIESKGSRDSWASAVKEAAPSVNGLDGSSKKERSNLNLGSDPATDGQNGSSEVHGTDDHEVAHSIKDTPDFPAWADGADDDDHSAHEEVDNGGKSPDEDSGNDETVVADGSDHGGLIYEQYRSKSGTNLASVRPSSDVTSTKSRVESPTSEPPPEVEEERDSQLVSGRQAGAGWSQSAIHWAPLNIPLQRRLQTLMVLLHTLSIVVLLSLFLMCCAIPLLWPLIVPYMLRVIFSRASVDGKLSYRSERFRQSRIWSLFGSYFPARLHRSQTLEPTRKYIFGYHPHGIISHGAFAAFATEALGFGQLFPGITNTLLTLDANFTVPFYREYVLKLGLASVSRESCENILGQGGPNGEGMGRAITIVIGGARESLDALPGKMRLVLKRRKGFVKLGIRTGADLVPVLGFGENDIYEQLDGNSHPLVHNAQLLAKKFMGFTVPLFHARGVFNYDVGIMPYRRPINIVVGRPIEIMQSKNPDPKYVDEIHAKYMQELQRIWDDWKDTFVPHRTGELELIE